MCTTIEPSKATTQGATGIGSTRQNPRRVQAGDRIKLRYDPADNEKSVFLGFC